MEVSAFKIDIPQAELDDLKARLAATRWPGALEGVGWSYGMDDAYLRGLVADWIAFDWRAQEAWLNSFPQFTAMVDGQKIHFVHVKGRGPNPRPIILSHGWPSSFIEWLPIVERLSNPAAFGADPADSFDVVIPSLPGYGFSGVPTKPGMNPRRIGQLFAGLMKGLGYEKYLACGCDWGSFVTSFLALDDAAHVAGAHLSSLSMSHAPVPGRPREPKSPELEAYNQARKVWGERETGYVAIQSTKPQTLAYGLTDSPAGLASWIAEKFRAWTDHAGDPAAAVPRATLLTNIAIYWFTRTINSASRLYYENRQSPFHLEPGQRVEVPCAFFTEAPTHQRPKHAQLADATPRSGQAPRERVEQAYNVQRWTQAAQGGHFPAIETPQLIADDLHAFSRMLRATGRY